MSPTILRCKDSPLSPGPPRKTTSAGVKCTETTILQFSIASLTHIAVRYYGTMSQGYWQFYTNVNFAS